MVLLLLLYDSFLQKILAVVRLLYYITRILLLLLLLLFWYRYNFVGGSPVLGRRPGLSLRRRTRPGPAGSGVGVEVGSVVGTRWRRKRCRLAGACGPSLCPRSAGTRRQVGRCVMCLLLLYMHRSIIYKRCGGTLLHCC